MNTTQLQRIADYARISEDDEKDPELRGENVTLQLEETAAFRAQHAEWTHAGSFSDNDISASIYSDEDRPDFEKLMLLIRTSGVEVLVCTEVTRPFRRPLESETVIDLVVRKKTSFYLVVTTRGGYYDLRTSAGRKALRDAVNSAAGESDNISDRVRVKKSALARRGMPNGGRRPYGFEPDHITLREPEVAIMREIGDRLIHGESPRWIYEDLNNRGVPTAENGKGWSKGTMLNMMRRVRYAPYGNTDRGIREHNGVQYKAVWPAVFDAATWAQLQMTLAVNETIAAKRGEPRKYPLAGFVYCGGCGSKLGGSMKRDRPTHPNKPRYRCRPYDVYGHKTGCAGVTVMAEALEDWVISAVLYRLDSSDFAQIFGEKDEDSASFKATLEANRAQKQKLDELIDNYYGSNPDHLTREQFLRAKAAAELTLEETERELERHNARRALMGMPIGETMLEAYRKHEHDLGWVRRLISLPVDKIIVQPGGGKPYYQFKLTDKTCRFDPERVEIIWSV